MKQITNLSISMLKVHPRNQEFFDDIEGSTYEQLKKSIEEDGVITPLIIAPDGTIISGHQRYKVCLDLGIDLVPVIIQEDLTNEDKKLKILLASNFGRLKNDENKQRKVAVEYVKLCGLKHGANQFRSHDNQDSSLTRQEIANNLGISVSTLDELLLIERKLTPEMKDLIDNGIITKTTASKVLTKLSPTEQEELLLTYGKEIIDGATQKQVQEYANEIVKLKNTNASLQLKINNKDIELKNAVANESERLNRQIINLNNEKCLLERKVKLNQDDSDKYQKLKKDIDFLTQQKTDLSRQITSATELAGLTVRLQNVLEKELAPIQYKRCIDILNENDVAMQNFIDVVNIVEKWLVDMKTYLPNKNIINVDYKEI